MTLELDYQRATEADHIPDAAACAKILQAALDGVRQQDAGAVEDEPEITLRIVGEDEGRNLNLTYRGRDQATNVLSFPFDAPDHVDSHLLGDLVVCAPVVEAEAAEQDKPVDAHWAHMLIHGALHLLGYDHITDKDAQIMERLERDILARLGCPDPYAGDQ